MRPLAIRVATESAPERRPAVVAIARRVGSILEEAHYRHVLIDDKMSSEIFDRYIESLDGQHSYFLASDLKEFEQWRYRFDDMIHSGDVEPGFAIFARYQQRNRERVAAALKMQIGRAHV